MYFFAAQCRDFTYTPDMSSVFGKTASGLSIGLRGFLLSLITGIGVCSCTFDRVPESLGLTPDGSGARVRFDLSHQPLPEIPMPNDTATWPDPTSRTGLRINASLVAPTQIEQQARERFSQMEGWGTFAPITVSFDHRGGSTATSAALDLGNVRTRHQGDDYDFVNDAIYLIDMQTGVPVPLDLGDGNFDYTLKKLDRYWANDSRASERNLMFETIDETAGGTITQYAPEHDTDFDGVLDQPNFENPAACPDPDPICDDPGSGAAYTEENCVEMRRSRDRCVMDNLLTWYERETDTLIVRPLLPLREMNRYAVVLTNRLLDSEGEPVRSPFDQIYHASQGLSAERVAQILDTPSLQSYYGDIHGTGLSNVAFVWSFTTQPTVDDMKRLRDGLYGHGPFARWSTAFPPKLEMQRMVGLRGDLDQGVTEDDGWPDSALGKAADCPNKAGDLFRVDYDGVRDVMKLLVEQGFGLGTGPSTDLLLRRFEAIDHLVIGTFRAPFLLEGGPQNTDPNAAFSLDYVAGTGVESEDTVQVWMIVPKETETHKQPFDVNVYGHGYTGSFLEMMIYAGNMADHGLATVGINAMGHGLVVDEGTKIAASALLGSACYRPMFDAMTLSRARDLNRDGIADSGGDFWSSFLFHTRDGVRQSVLDQIQLVRIMRAFGQPSAVMDCRDDAKGPLAVSPCTSTSDPSPRLAGDFDDDGVADLGGPDARYATWGESLGGILSGIHGAIDPYVTSTVPGSGGGGLTDIGARSFQGGVLEAVLLRLWGPLLVSVPAESRKACADDPREGCTVCKGDQLSVRWTLPNVNDTGEVEITCVEVGTITNTTVLARNIDGKETRCTRVGDDGHFRIGLPASTGDRVAITFWNGVDQVDSYGSCRLRDGAELRHTIEQWGAGDRSPGDEGPTASCQHASCKTFQGLFFGEGEGLSSPGDGFGLLRQSPALRRFLGLAQAALEPGDPISFAPYYSMRTMTDASGQIIEPHAVLTLNTIGDMSVPLNAGIAFARATGALPFFRPDQLASYPAYADFVTPPALYEALGQQTPNQQLVDRHVIEGITALAREPAGPECAASANSGDLTASYADPSGQTHACFPSGCSATTEQSSETRVCHSGSSCDLITGQCAPKRLGKNTCDEALWDADDLDEGAQRYFEQHAKVPHRLARLTQAVNNSSLEEVWAPRLQGVPFASDDSAYKPQAAPEGRLTALLDAYVVPQGTHTFANGNPCEAFDSATYWTNLVARFFASDGTDVYYLSHPATHRCLANEFTPCQ